MYTTMGDKIALQYGGSEAQKKMKQDGADHQSKPQGSAIITTIRRYYSNSFSDGPKQDAYNLFLGLFRPYDRKPGDAHIWELDSDFYLHNKNVLSNLKRDFAFREPWWSLPLRKFEENLSYLKP